MLDVQIRNLRRKFSKSLDEGEAFDILMEIDRLQRQRFKEVGSFLPILVNGLPKVFVFDLDYQRWFELPNNA